MLHDIHAVVHQRAKLLALRDKVHKLMPQRAGGGLLGQEVALYTVYSKAPLLLGQAGVLAEEAATHVAEGGQSPDLVR